MSLDDYFPQDTAPAVVTEPKPCRHPKYMRSRTETVTGPGWICDCGHFADPDKIKQGRRNRSRGNAKERASAKRNGTVRTGHFQGKDDFRVGDLFAVQNKSMATSRFPGWMTVELDALRTAWPSREPVLHVEEAPGPGKRARRLYVVDEKTWLALHGEAK